MKRLILIAFLLAACASPRRVALPTPTSEYLFLRDFSPASAPKLVQETSGTVESVNVQNGAWLVTAGGVPASSHFARLKYKVPESEGVVTSDFYIAASVTLPADFYTKQKAGFRILGVGNSPTTLNGVPVGGAGSGRGLFVSLMFNSDQTLRVAGQYGSNAPVYYANLGKLPVGTHYLEFYGDVTNAAPWYVKINGQTVASGTARLSPSAVPVSERIVTRFVAGIDGAANQDANPMSLFINSLRAANYDAGDACRVGQSIQSVIDNPKCSEITVTGNYKENLLITRPLILRGDNAMLDGQIKVKGTNNVIISGFEIYVTNRAGVFVEESQGIIVQNNLITTPAFLAEQTDGIYSQRNTGNIYDGNTIIIYNTDPAGHDDGIQSYLDTDLTIRGNDVRQVNSKVANAQGIYVTTPQGGLTRIYNNVVDMGDAKSNGISFRTLTGSGAVEIVGNTVRGKDLYHGIWVTETDAPTVKNNTVFLASGAAFTLSGSNVNVSGNVTNYLVTPTATPTRTPTLTITPTATITPLPTACVDLYKICIVPQP